MGTKIFGRFAHIVTYVRINLFIHENQKINSLELTGRVQGASADRVSGKVEKSRKFSLILEIVYYLYS